MKANGSPPPEFETDDDRTYFLIRLPIHPATAREIAPQVAPQVTPQVESLVMVMDGELTRAELMALVGLKDRSHFVKKYLQPALDAGLVEMTLPDKPRSRKQRYRLTLSGRQFREKIVGSYSTRS